MFKRPSVAARRFAALFACVPASVCASAPAAPLRPAAHPARSCKRCTAGEADLVVRSASTTLAGDNWLVGAAVIKNSGSRRAPRSVVGVNWRRGAHGTVSELGRFALPALASRHALQARFEMPVPAGSVSGRYLVSVCADAALTIREVPNGQRCRRAGAVVLAVAQPTQPTSAAGVSGTSAENPSSQAVAAHQATTTTTDTATATTTTTTTTATVTGPPQATITAGPSGPVNSTSATFAFVSNEPDNSFQCTLDSAAWAPCTSPQAYSALAQGPHLFKVRAINSVGETELTPAERPWTVETIAPTTTIESAPSGRVETGSAEISFSSNQANSTFECSLDGAGFSACVTPLKLSGLAPGPHSFTVRAKDPAGGTDPAPPHAEWDYVAPTIDLCGPIAHDQTLSLRYAVQYIVTCPATIQAGVTVTAEPGTVIKGEGMAGIDVSGVLDAVGTRSEPVTVTSVNDDTVGAVTGDGSPKAGDWNGITVEDGGAADLVGTTLQYATTAISAAEEADVTIHGSVLNSTVGVSSSTYVDATEVNWGSPSGPQPAGSGTPVKDDGAWVTPWVGYTEPSETGTASWQPSPVACSDFVVIGARGSGEPPQGAPPTFSDNQSGFGEHDAEAYEGFEAAMEKSGYTSTEFEPLGLHYPAVSVTLPFFLRPEYFESVAAGEQELISELTELASACPHQRAVLIGDSQGALVVHLALRQLAASDPSMLSDQRIAGVMLIADPARVAHGKETLWEQPEVEATEGSAVANVPGLWTAARARDFGPLPPAITERTISFCADHDWVCALGFGADWSVHEGFYNSTNLGAMGRVMARRVVAGH
jgi:hypothetical protein